MRDFNIGIIGSSGRENRKTSDRLYEFFCNKFLPENDTQLFIASLNKFFDPTLNYLSIRTGIPRKIFNFCQSESPKHKKMSDNKKMKDFAFHCHFLIAIKNGESTKAFQEMYEKVVNFFIEFNTIYSERELEENFEGRYLEVIDRRHALYHFKKFSYYDRNLKSWIPEARIYYL